MDDIIPILKMIWEFVWGNLKSLLLGIIFLLIGLFIVPEERIIIIIEKIKPGIIKKIKAPLINFINTLTNLYINNSIINLEEADESFNKTISDLFIQNDKIDKNIYVLDLCKDIVKTLEFVFPTDDAYFEIYDQAFSYLYHYSNLIESIEQDKNFSKNIGDKILELQDTYKEYFSTDKITDKLTENKSEEEIEKEREDLKQIYKAWHQRTVNEVFNYLKQEKDKLEIFKIKNKDEITKLLKQKINTDE